VLGVSRSGFYAWCGRAPSAREVENQELKREIVRVFHDSRCTYGSPRIHPELRESGYRVGKKRVARLMKEAGITAQPRKKRRRRASAPPAMVPVAGNLLDRQFDVPEPNQVWVTDISYVWTWEGWLYLAIVLDLFSRRVVGWAMADHMRTELVTAAFEMAVGQRLPDEGLLHHSDQGGQYASYSYQKILERRGITASMSRRGDCYDNAAMESFFATIKKELIYRSSWPTRREARAAIHDYIALFYNRKRRHSYLGHTSPAEFERKHSAAMLAA
jgi:transposase InsO family protein